MEDGDITTATPGRPSFSAGAPLHSLKFNYDATTPLVNITLSIHPSPPPVIHDENGKEAPSIVEEEPKTIYSGVHGGGFNQVFQLPAESAIDLSSAISPIPPNMNGSTPALGEDDDKVLGGARGATSEDTTRSSLDHSMTNLQISQQPDLATVPEMTAAPETTEERRPRRFGIFPRRGQREPDPEAAIELQNRVIEEEEKEKNKVKEPELGMRLLIRIEAIGPEGEIPASDEGRDGLLSGQALKRRNAQLTHILITGMWVPEAGSTAPPGQNGKRVWVVKVVRREAVVSDIPDDMGYRVDLPDRCAHIPAQGDLWLVVIFDPDRDPCIPTWRSGPLRINTQRVYCVSHFTTRCCAAPLSTLGRVPRMRSRYGGVWCGRQSCATRRWQYRGRVWCNRCQCSQWSDKCCSCYTHPSCRRRDHGSRARKT